MFITSSEASKLLAKLTNDKETILSNEVAKRVFCAATSEDPEKLRPDYSFSVTQEKIDKINRRIMEIRHKLNLFNTSTVVIDGLTIDQVLIRMPQLQKQKNKLQRMMRASEKTRVSITGNIIDYEYTNYNPKEAKNAFDEVSKEIDDLQLALDAINNTVKFEIDDN